MQQQLQLLTAHDYFPQITNKIAHTKKGDRVALMTMAFQPSEKPLRALMHELANAARRGVHVQLNVDAHSFMVNDTSQLPTGPLVLRGHLKHPRHSYAWKLGVLEELASAGGSYRIVNQPARRPLNPYSGHSHIKYTVINDEAYLGGCNLSHTSQADAMIRFKDPKTVDWIYRFILGAHKIGNVTRVLDGKDYTHSLDDATQFFVDAGVERQSLIYDEALGLIDEAKEWLVITCQFFPNGTTAKHLAAAVRRGVDVRVYFNNPRQQTPLHIPALQVVQWSERLLRPQVLLKHQLKAGHSFIHAKLLASEQAAIIGSHNYVPSGVKFGTAETALLRRDPAFAQQIAGMVKKLVT